MEFKFLCVLLFSFIFSNQSIAGLSCNVAKNLQEAAQTGKLDDSFWQAYARLGNQSDREVAELLRKHGAYDGAVENAGRRNTDAPVVRQRPVVQRTVQKEVDIMPPGLRQKYAEVVDQLTQDPSGRGFYSNPGRWHFEKLPRYGATAHSVRLDGGYRVLIDIKDGAATIRAVNKSIGH